MRFTVLGPVGASADGQLVPITRAQRRAVLAFLLLNANRTVTVTELIDALWEAGPPATARTQVFAAVSAVRRALRTAGAEPVTSVHGGYRLDAGPGELDLLAFDDAVTGAREHAGRGDLRPLLPGSSPALVLVTSRDALGGLIARDGARRLEVDLLPYADALDLITRILGADRVAAEPEAAADLVAVCGRLPLALRIAAAHLTVRPGDGIAGYVARTRLESLAIDGDPASNLRAVFDQSYRCLTAADATAGRLAGRHGRVAVIQAGTALGCPDAVWRLAFACRFHFNGRLDGPTALSLVRAAVEAADRTGDVRAQAAAALVIARAYTTDAHDDRCRAHARRCLELAGDSGWHDIESDAHNTLSVHHMFAGDLRLAADHARLAFDHSMACGVVPPQFLGKVGLIMLLMGRLAEAADCFGQTLAHQPPGFGQAVTLLNLAETRRLQGRDSEAGGHLDEAVGHLTAEGNTHLVALVRADQAVLVHRQGRHQEAWRMLEDSRTALAGRIDMLNGWQLTQRHAELLIASGRAAEAVERLRPAIEQVSAMVGLQQPATQLLVVLAGAHLGDDPRQAAEVAAEAVESARKGQFLLLEGQALTILAQALRRLGRDAEAREAAEEALGVHEQTGHQPGRDGTAALLGELDGQTGRPRTARTP